jgi:7-cyano-7-deazaguanine reductase
LVTIRELKEQYESLDHKLPTKGEQAVDDQCLLTFQYDYPEQAAQVEIDTDEFTALCPWTGLPDYGTLCIAYVPDRSCIELKSLKYYLLSYRDVGIVQEHAANRILKDLVSACGPRYMKVTLDYKVRGGIHTSVSVEYPGGGSSNAPDSD